MGSTAMSFTPVSAPTGVPIKLAMQRLFLTGQILPAGARLTVRHVFRSDEEKPLEVIYSFPLPRDAALRAFRITGENFEAHSELKQTEEAVKAYEKGIADGSLSTLARQYGDGVVNLTVGNIRPNETITVHLELLAGVEARDDGFRFRFPFTLAPAYHPHMKVAAVGDGEGEIELPAGEFGDMILPRFRDDAPSLHEVGFEITVLPQAAIDEIGSPSHSIRVKQNGITPARVALAHEKDVPNRDLVLDVRFKEAGAQVLAGPNQHGGQSFAAIVPSTLFGQSVKTPRRTVIVLDRSGSMQGVPIAQARKAIEACLAVLEEDDSFGLVAFDNEIESMEPSLLLGTRENREKARAFLDSVQARGGTELAKGFLEASRMLDGAGDVFILTDGQVAGTEQILAQARTANIRLFCLGIGSASQDRFLSLLSRETGGISRFVTGRERVDLAAVDLFASMGQPVVSGLKAGGNVQPEPPSSVFAGTPILLFGDGSGPIELTWNSGSLTLPVPAGNPETGATVHLLQGSRLITDWESRYPSEEALAPLDRRKQTRVAGRLAELSQTFGLASREMSLVAVVKRANDRPGELPETRVVPVGMPQDVKFGSYFGASAARVAASFQPMMSAMAPPPPPGSPVPVAFAKSASAGLTNAFRNMFGQTRDPEVVAPISNDDLLMDLAAQLEPDGGMPGKTPSIRAARTIAAVFAFIAEGHSLTSGAFRSHVTRLIAFLQNVTALPGKERALVDRAIKLASTASAPPVDWLGVARGPDPSWTRLEGTLK